jgi:hypothetical protein
LVRCVSTEPHQVSHQGFWPLLGGFSGTETRAVSP